MTGSRRSVRAVEGSDPYPAALGRLFALRRFGMRPGLGPIQTLLAELGHPERAFPAVHITGSKGKGSVAAMTERILRASGRRVGLFTSPHLVSYRERIRVNGVPIPKPAVVEGIARIEASVASALSDHRLERPPTFFEVTTALALDWFRAKGVDAAVVEVGIGGRLDATNVLRSEVGAITTIELEHTEVLGDTLRAIASEKAGILHPGMFGVLGELPREADAAVEAAAGAAGVPLWRLGGDLGVGPRTIAPSGQRFDLRLPGLELPGVEIPLAGTFQSGNAALAAAIARRFGASTGHEVGARAIRLGLAKVRWRGRLERIRERPLTYFDVAHTPESVRAIAESLAELHPFLQPAESALLFGCLDDKRSDSMLSSLSTLATTVVLVPVRSARSKDPDELRREATGLFPRVVRAPDPVQGYALARACVGPDGVLLALGSDYLIGELLGEIEGTAGDGVDLSDPGLTTPGASEAEGAPTGEPALGVPPAGRGL